MPHAIRWCSRAKKGVEVEAAVGAGFGGGGAWRTPTKFSSVLLSSSSASSIDAIADVARSRGSRTTPKLEPVAAVWCSSSVRPKLCAQGRIESERSRELSAVPPKTSMHARTLLAMLSCVSITPLGSPVVPLV